MIDYLDYNPNNPPPEFYKEDYALVMEADKFVMEYLPSEIKDAMDSLGTSLLWGHGLMDCEFFDSILSMLSKAMATGYYLGRTRQVVSSAWIKGMEEKEGGNNGE